MLMVKYKKIILIFILFVISSLIILSVYANNNDIGYVEIKATVDDSFKEDICLNYFDDNRFNIIISLNKSLDYCYKGMIPTGVYKLDPPIKIDGYEVIIANEFKINKDKLTSLDMKIISLNKTSLTPFIQDIETTKFPTTTVHSNDKNNIPGVKEKSNLNGIITYIILILLIIVFAVIKLRNKL